MKENKELIENIDIKPSQMSIPKSSQTDVVEGVYSIQLSEPIHQLSNDFCKYFNVVSPHKDHKYFAIIFEKDFNVDIGLLELLSNNQSKHLNNLITFSIVRLSHIQSSRLVAIVRAYDIENSLGHYIERNGPLSSDQINKKLIPQLNSLLSWCEGRNINCGNINPYNILIENDGNFILREFFIAYPHYSQLEHYLAPEIIECVNVGRKIIDNSADIYALSITIFFSLTGKQPWKEYSRLHRYNEERLEQSTYKLLIFRKRISEHFKVFFKGTMNDNIKHRWKTKNLTEWLQDHLSKSVFFEGINESVNIINFKNSSYSTSKSIAYALFNNWEHAISFIQDDKLLKWIKRDQRSEKDIENVQAFFTTERNIRNTNLTKIHDRSDRLSKILIALDPQGAIRVNNLAFSAPSIPVMLYHYMVHNKRAQADNVIKVIQNKYWRIATATPSACTIDQNQERNLEHLIDNYSPNSTIFGLERLVYSLNKYIPCLSPIIKQSYCITLADLLVALDKVANQTPNKFNIDRHIIAFIAAKINLKNEMQIKLLSDFPKFSEHPFIYGIGIISIVQQQTPEIKIPNLCHVLVDKITELFNDHLHNVKFKNNMIDDLKEIAKEGDLSKVVNILSNQKPFIDDYNGYYKACKELQNISNQIKYIGVEDKVFSDATLLGQKMTVLMSYILCLIVTVILVI